MIQNNDNGFGRIGVLMGGYSSERDISLKSGRAIFEALHRQGCQVVSIDIVEPQMDRISTRILEEDIDLAFSEGKKHVEFRILRCLLNISNE